MIATKINNPVRYGNIITDGLETWDDGDLDRMFTAILNEISRRYHDKERNCGTCGHMYSLWQEKYPCCDCAQLYSSKTTDHWKPKKED